MARKIDSQAGKRRKLPLLGAVGAAMLALPTAGLAVVGFAPSAVEVSTPLGFFTPASVDPDLAARVAQKARERGIRFTPAGSNPIVNGKTVTVAVRINTETAKAVSVRSSIDAAPGKSDVLAAMQSSKFNLGTARGYQSFARPIQLPSNVRSMSVPDLAEFAPATSRVENRPSRLQPRIELEDRAIAGRSVNTLDASESSVDVGGSFRLSKNLDVTAGVRYSQERDRIAPLTDSVQDSQAVYVGTQIRF